MLTVGHARSAGMQTCAFVEPDEEVDDQAVQRDLDDGPRDLRHAHGRRPGCGGEEPGVTVLVEHAAAQHAART